jgi:hypothetical protein
MMRSRFYDTTHDFPLMRHICPPISWIWGNVLKWVSFSMYSDAVCENPSTKFIPLHIPPQYILPKFAEGRGGDSIKTQNTHRKRMDCFPAKTDSSRNSGVDFDDNPGRFTNYICVLLSNL